MKSYVQQKVLISKGDHTEKLLKRYKLMKEINCVDCEIAGRKLNFNSKYREIDVCNIAGYMLNLDIEVNLRNNGVDCWVKENNKLVPGEIKTMYYSSGGFVFDKQENAIKRRKTLNHGYYFFACYSDKEVDVFPILIYVHKVSKDDDPYILMIKEKQKNYLKNKRVLSEKFGRPTTPSRQSFLFRRKEVDEMCDIKIEKINKNENRFVYKISEKNIEGPFMIKELVNF